MGILSLPLIQVWTLSSLPNNSVDSLTDFLNMILIVSLCH